MYTSVFDIFKIGIGPSSSHTVAPMVAARKFLFELKKRNYFLQTEKITVDLYGSLGLTGKGHGSAKAIVFGLTGEEPKSVDPESATIDFNKVELEEKIFLLGEKEIKFDVSKDIKFVKKLKKSFHTNMMIFSVKNSDNRIVFTKDYYSIGGGFVVAGDEVSVEHEDSSGWPFPFKTGKDLLDICNREGLSISSVMLENEKHWRPEAEVRSKLLKIWKVMETCIEKGCMTEGVLPGGIRLKRRAPEIFRKLKNQTGEVTGSLMEMDWVNLYALAVSEQNAAGGKVVTAPTNGAAGIIPAVLFYLKRVHKNFDDEFIVRFLLSAGAIGVLFKENASLSGAEMGCQGEVGVACSMAAGAMAEAMGGTPLQAENAAEIGMEHNLGLTCDPVGGLVQIPCIERNAMGAVKAINAARLGLQGDGQHHISLDKVIKTMHQTGKDMQTKYKETSLGGLAINLTEC